MSTADEAKLLRAFGKHLADIRKNKGMTQSGLAERVNMSVVTIAYLETGKRWVRINTLYKIAKALGVDMGDLLKGIKP